MSFYYIWHVCWLSICICPNLVSPATWPHSSLPAAVTNRKQHEVGGGWISRDKNSQSLLIHTTHRQIYSLTDQNWLRLALAASCHCRPCSPRFIRIRKAEPMPLEAVYIQTSQYLVTRSQHRWWCWPRRCRQILPWDSFDGLLWANFLLRDQAAPTSGWPPHMFSVLFLWHGSPFSLCKANNKIFSCSHVSAPLWTPGAERKRTSLCWMSSQEPEQAKAMNTKQK